MPRAKKAGRLVVRGGSGEVLFYECPRCFEAVDPSRGCEGWCSTLPPAGGA